MLTLPISGVCARRACVAAMTADSRGSGKRKMSTNIGPFEILSELAKSPTGAVYKANDPDGGQTIALKVIQLNAFGDSSAALEQALLAEAESTKAMSSPNITPVFGAGVIEGQFCAAMEYVQGNSIATMLARKEGFSIWDLLDIGRQLGGAFDYAISQGIVHYSLEPAKIMCGWDGTVRILSYGVSSAGIFAHHVSGGIPACLHYMSPEQVQGQTTDGRSNLFSLGAMLYEMVTERKAFDREDIEGLRQCILESTPVAPVQVNPKVHPLLSDLIMKALAKDPAERYQTGRQLLDDLEKCKESKPVAAKKPEAPKGVAAPKPNPAAQAKFAAPAAPRPAAAKPAPAPKPVPKPAPTAPAPTPPTAASGLARPASSLASSEAKSTLAKPADKKLDSPPSLSADAKPSALATPVSKLAVPKAAAAAAGAGGADATLPSPEVPEIDLSNQFIAACVKATIDEPQISEHQVAEPEVGDHQLPSASMSAAVVDEPQIESPEPVVETFEPQVDEDAPRIAVDPMMAEGGQKSGGGVSFSEMTELPPLKEVYIPPPPPQPPVSFRPAQSAGTGFSGNTKKEDEKPKIQPREVAQKAIKEIKGVPPKLMLYALAGAGVLILAIGIGVTIYIHSLSGDDDAGAPKTSEVAETPAQPDASQPAPEKAPAPARAAKSQPAEPEREAPVAEPAPARGRNAKLSKKVVTPALVIPGQIAIDSTPQGAQVQVDGKSDPSYVTPFVLTNLDPGQHSITVSKAGYTTDTRAVAVTSANRTTTVIHLAQLMATLIVKSDPPGANIYVDGRDVGTRTPAQVSVDKGQHVVLVRMSGYIDETMNAQFSLGQTFNFAPALRSLGNTDSIKPVGKMSKLFGGKGADAGQAILTIHTQPKGAQIAINQHMLDKGSPVDVALDPGNYVIDITQSGYAPIHKVISVDKGGKAVIDEVMQRQ
jgi:serine/threonine protein kinase